MKAFILAAGKGTRMRPLTSETPKPILPLAGKPILQHLVDNLERSVEEIIVLVGWHEDEIKGEIKSEKAEIKYVRQEEPLGTAHAIKQAKEHVDDKFICLNGDVIISKSSLKEFITQFSKKENCMMGLAKVDNPKQYGIAKTEDGKVTDLIEKPDHPPTNNVNSGLYGFTSQIFELIEKTQKSSRGEFEITDTLKKLIDKKELSSYELKNDWHELSRPWDILSVNKELMKKELKEQINGKIEDNVHIEGKVHISEGAEIREGSYIKGPVYIGKNAEIGPNCYIRPCTHLAANTKVGNAVEVKNSVIMEGTKIPHHNYVGDSVIGKDCNFGSGTKVGNLRLDSEGVRVVHRSKKIETDRRKLGVIMGARVKTGINSMINPGTIIWEDSFIGPGALAEGEIGADSRLQ